MTVPLVPTRSFSLRLGRTSLIVVFLAALVFAQGCIGSCGFYFPVAKPDRSVGFRIAVESPSNPTSILIAASTIECCPTASLLATLDNATTRTLLPGTTASIPASPGAHHVRLEVIGCGDRSLNTTVRLAYPLESAITVKCHNPGGA